MYVYCMYAYIYLCIMYIYMYAYIYIHNIYVCFVYEVSWEKVFFLWDMRSDLTLGYREASEAYQSVMLKWKVHKNAYQAFQLLVLAQALYQT